jgi:hypothetical protein
MSSVWSTRSEARASPVVQYAMSIRLSLLMVTRSAPSLRSVALHNEETTRVREGVQRLCDGGKVVTWRIRRNGLRSG